MKVTMFENAFATNIIYVATINVDSHRDCVKIGKASTTKHNPTHADLVEAARERVNDYSRTLGIKVNLEWVEAAIRPDRNGIAECFMDHDVHSVLKRSGVKKKHFGTGANEWYQCSVETAKRAIAAVKARQTTLSNEDVSDKWEPLSYRPEQQKAIEQTLDVFNGGDEMLWNAKMRFGKTVSALEVVKRMNLRRTLIFTHRPVVINGWYKDFQMVFGDSLDRFAFGSKTLGKHYDELERKACQGKGNYIYFASLQDLRGSEEVGGNFDKNDELFSTPWDLLIVDEAHEGTLTTLGESVLKALRKDGTKVLRLSGTPYNLLEKFDSNAVYTWDYTMEQKAKAAWDAEHPDEPNPYAMLPAMNIYTYDLARLMSEKEDEVSDMAFNFREFFRTDGDYDRFIHEADVIRFLNLLAGNDVLSLYPYSNELFQGIFRHTLWMLPGVKAARALSKLLKAHPIFRKYTIVNVAGEGDEEEEAEEALAKLETAITKHPEQTKTITLSCGRLTTGVTVPAWTGVFMLSGSAKTSAAGYMQTIFRVQSPGSIGGLMKEQCYVFDFAPDRALQVVAEANKIQNFKNDGTSQSDRDRLEEFLKFCNFYPVIAKDGSGMKPYDADSLLRQLKRVFIERVVQSGFDDIHIFDKATFRRLSADELNMFKKLQEIIGKTKALPKTKAIDVNRSGLTDEEYERAEQAEEAKQEGKKLTPEQKAALEKLKEQRKQEDIAASILRGISIRMPLMVYGAELKDEAKELDIDNFTNLVDDASWEEFMPKGVTKELFNDFKQYFDREIFTGASMRIRQLVHEADNLNIDERIEQITTVFSYFRNPDKETVLTPWRVVNMHMGDTLGGYVFYDKDYSEPPLLEPRFANQGELTKEVFAEESRILEINSKTGLYPLYVTYNFYRTRRRLWEAKYGKQLTHDEQQKLWYTVLKDNVFVLCMTPMAAAITRRTLAGFHRVVVNAKYYPDLINEIKNNKEKLISTVRQGKTFWRTNNDDNMKFNAIVGNPPYQYTVEQRDSENGQKVTVSIFQHFQMLSDKLGRYTSLIYPGARWIHRSGKGLERFGLEQINDSHLAMLKFFPDSMDVFKDVAIADGLSIVMKDSTKKTRGFKYVYSKNGSVRTVNATPPGEKLFVLNPADTIVLNCIESTVSKYGFEYLHDAILPRSLFSIESDFVEKNPHLVREYNDGDTFNTDTEIKLFTNDKAGKAGRARWYIASKDVITSGLQELNRWKVIVSSANAGGQKRSNQIAIADNHSAFGRSRVALKTFATEAEAKNFYKYCKSDLIRFAFLLTDESLTSLAKKVPDLQDYRDSNPLIDFAGDVNAELYALFGIDKENQEYIRSVLATKAE